MKNVQRKYSHNNTTPMSLFLFKPQYPVQTEQNAVTGKAHLETNC
jgi:hypothetical protein